MEKEDFIGMDLSEDISDEDFKQVVEGYQKIKDQMSKEDFIAKFNEFKGENKDISFFTDVDFLNMVVQPLSDEENVSISEIDTDVAMKISDVEPGNEGFSVIVRVMGISNVKTFTTKRGRPGRLCNIQIADNTEEVRCVLWTQNMKFLNHIQEGDIVKISDIECREGYRGGKEFSLRPRSSIAVVNTDSEIYPKDIDAYPVYEEEFSSIADLTPDEEGSILARVVRVPKPHSYQSNGKKGKVVSIEVQDATGKIQYTLWNNDVKLIEDLELKVGDIVKILNEQVRERNGELSISHWNGRIAKAEGDYDIPEFVEELEKIAIAQDDEAKDAILLGIITKIFDIIEFDRQDGTKGYVRSIELTDDTASIRVTLWGDDAHLELNKGDILKIIGGNIEMDDFAPSGYRVNTNWNTELILNPESGDEEFIQALKDYAADLGPVSIGDIQDIEDDGDEIDIIARLITLNNVREFTRDDGSDGTVLSGDFADSTGSVRISFWDEKTEYPFEIGKAYKLENARTRLGMYAVELNAGKPTRIIEASEEEIATLPSFEELENAIYEPRKIGDLDEDDNRFKVVARILNLTDTREFDKQDGTKGLVRSMDIGDDSGVIRVSLWDDKAKIPCDIGDPIKIQNPSVRFDNNNEMGLSVGGASTITDPSESELADIPTIEELEDMLYVSKEIGDLEDEDKNIRVKGILGDVYAGKLLIPRCPFCNNTLEEDETECSYCGNEVDEPKYLLMIPGRLEDSTGDIQITFFNVLAQELIGMNMDEMIEIVEDSGDEGVLEGKVENLNGLTIEVLADVSFNEYNEEIRLNPKRIFSTEL